MLFLNNILIVLVSCITFIDASVPIINIAILYNHSATIENNEDYFICASAIDKALVNYGVFTIVGHKLEGTIATTGLASAKKLFNLPLEKKNSVRIKSSTKAFSSDNTVQSEAVRGYLPYGAESGLLNTYFEAKEGFSYGYVEQSKNTSIQNEICRKTALHGINIWPLMNTSYVTVPLTERMKSVEETDTDILHDAYVYAIDTIQDMNDVYNGSIEIAQLLSIAIARYNIYRIQTESNTLIDEDQLVEQLAPWVNMSKVITCGEEISVMRLFHYYNLQSPVIQESIAGADVSKILGSSPHTDWGFLTVILQDHIGGLQFLQQSDKHTGSDLWIDVPSVTEYSMIINGGDYLSLYSQYRYKSPIHRVLLPKHESMDRYSFVLFFYPNYYSTFLPSTVSVANRLSVQSDSGSELNYTPLSSTSATIDPKTLPNAPTSIIYNTYNTSDVYEYFGDYIINKWRGVFNKHY